MYSQLQGQLSQMQEAIQDKEGTIETLERQLVQAGIKGKIMQAEVEINKKKEDTKGNMESAYVKTEGEQKYLRDLMKNEVDKAKSEMQLALDAVKQSGEKEDKK